MKILSPYLEQFVCVFSRLKYRGLDETTENLKKKKKLENLTSLRNDQTDVYLPWLLQDRPRVKGNNNNFRWSWMPLMVPHVSSIIKGRTLFLFCSVRPFCRGSASIAYRCSSFTLVTSPLSRPVPCIRGTHCHHFRATFDLCDLLRILWCLRVNFFGGHVLIFGFVSLDAELDDS